MRQSSPNIVRSSTLDGDPLKLNFKNFLWKTWRTLGFPDPTPLHYDVADYLQHGPDKGIIMGFRGMAKSYITVTFCNWALYCEPEEIVLTVSGTSRAAGLNAFFAFQMLSNFDWLAHMVPRTDQRRSALAFDVAGAKPKKSESFCSESLFGQITSRRATLIVPDDVEIPNTSDTEGKREELRKRFGELGAAILLPGGRIKVLGTAQTEESLYTELATSKGYAMRMWPILYPKPDELPKFGSWLAPRLVQELEANPSLAGTSTEPGRFSEADIAARELEWGRTEFARQFKLWLDAGLGKDTPLKMRDLTVLDWGPPPPDGPLKLPPEVRWGPTPANKASGIEIDSLPGDTIHYPAYVTPQDQWRPVEGIRCYVDPAGGTGNDETTWTITAHLNALGFLCHQGASLGGYSNPVLRSIATDCLLWRVQYIDVESNLGQGMFSALLRATLTEVASELGIKETCVIEDDRKGQQQKEHRIIASLEAPMTAHRIVINAAVLRADFSVTYEDIEEAKRRFYRLSYQLTRMTKAKGCVAHDDRADGFGSVMNKIAELFRLRTSDAQAQDKEYQLQEEIRHMIEVRQAQGLPTFGLESKQAALGRARPGGMTNSNFFRRPPEHPNNKQGKQPGRLTG